MNEDMTGTSIDLKATLRSIAYLRRQLVERLADIEDSVNQALGKEALIIDDMFDYERLAEKLQGPLDGRFLAPELLQRIYRDNRRYCWHNRSITIHISMKSLLGHYNLMLKEGPNIAQIIIQMRCHRNIERSLMINLIGETIDTCQNRREL